MEEHRLLFHTVPVLFFATSRTCKPPKTCKGEIRLSLLGQALQRGREDCGGRECYRLGIVPKRQEKYLIDGQIWIDAEDWGIVRIQGSPAKRPAIWSGGEFRGPVQSCRTTSVSNSARTVISPL